VATRRRVRRGRSRRPDPAAQSLGRDYDPAGDVGGGGRPAPDEPWPGLAAERRWERAFAGCRAAAGGEGRRGIALSGDRGRAVAGGPVAGARIRAGAVVRGTADAKLEVSSGTPAAAAAGAAVPIRADAHRRDRVPARVFHLTAPGAAAPARSAVAHRLTGAGHHGDRVRGRAPAAGTGDRGRTVLSVGGGHAGRRRGRAGPGEAVVRRGQ